jgi:hypothetical protein
MTEDFVLIETTNEDGLVERLSLVGMAADVDLHGRQLVGIKCC